jgi:hypothetical protein
MINQRVLLASGIALRERVNICWLQSGVQFKIHCQAKGNEVARVQPPCIRSGFFLNVVLPAPCCAQALTHIVAGEFVTH